MDSLTELIFGVNSNILLNTHHKNNLAQKSCFTFFYRVSIKIHMNSMLSIKKGSK